MSRTDQNQMCVEPRRSGSRNSRMLTTALPLIFVCWLAISFANLSNAHAQQPQITLAQFDSWIFGQMRDETTARQTLASQIDLEIERFDRVASFSEQQKAKLALAGAGDVKRFFDQIREARRKFIELGDVQQNQINEAHQLSVALSQRLNQGLFDTNSLLHKVALSIPDPEQAEIIRKHEQARIKQRTKNAIHAYVAMLGRSLPLTAVQRDQLIETIDERVEIKTSKNAYLSQLIAYRLSKVPEDQFESFLDDNQLSALKKTFARAEAMKPFLIQQGMIDDE